MMENFVVSALKYRPQQFKDVVGQQAITTTLENAISKNQLPQALLFCGPRGVGKTSCARILAKQINNQNEATVEQDYSFNIFELDAASNNSVDDIKEFKRSSAYSAANRHTQGLYYRRGAHALYLGL